MPLRRSRSRSAGDRRVDGDDQRLIPGGLRARDRRQRDVAAADQIQLIPGGPRRRRLHVLQPAAGQRGEDVAGAGLAGGARRLFFAARIEQRRCRPARA